MTTYDRIIEYGKKEGILEGMLKGKREEKMEGKMETQKEIVLNSSKQGLPLSLIANITNLTEDEVSKILSNHAKD